MLDLVLSKKSTLIKISIKSGIAAFCIVLAILLPQIAHIAGGVKASAVWMPLYFSALLAGCVLGWKYGLIVGILSPISSYLFTQIFLASGMPSLSRIPLYTIELALYGLISGLFEKQIQKNAFISFPAVLLSQVSGRLIYLIYNLIAGRSFLELMTNIQTGLTGLYLQAILIPLIIIILSHLLKQENQ